MKYAVICFTERGAWVCRRLFHKLREAGGECEAVVPGRFLREEWKKRRNERTGRRATFPVDRPNVCRKTGNDLCQRSRHCSTGHRSWVRDKMTDPPVVSVDEGAQFVIPLLSGHVGGEQTDWQGA